MKSKFAIILCTLLLGTCFQANAQSKKVKFEAGLNYPISFKEDGNRNNHLSLFFKLSRLHKEKRMWDIRLSLESRTHIEDGEFYGYTASYFYNSHSLSLTASENYILAKKKTFHALRRYWCKHLSRQ